jgi:hypothetical protein
MPKRSARAAQTPPITRRLGLTRALERAMDAA